MSAKRDTASQYFRIFRGAVSGYRVKHCHCKEISLELEPAMASDAHPQAPQYGVPDVNGLNDIAREIAGVYQREAAVSKAIGVGVSVRVPSLAGW